MVVGPNSWDFWTYANACGSFSCYLVTTLPSFFMNKWRDHLWVGSPSKARCIQGILSRHIHWNKMQHWHTSCRLVGWTAGASGRKFDREVEGGKSRVDCFQEISSSKQWKGKASSPTTQNLGYSYLTCYFISSRQLPWTVGSAQGFSANAPKTSPAALWQQEKTANLKQFLPADVTKQTSKSHGRRFRSFFQDPSLIYDPKLAVFKECFRKIRSIPSFKIWIQTKQHSCDYLWLSQHALKKKRTPMLNIHMGVS